MTFAIVDARESKYVVIGAGAEIAGALAAQAAASANSATLAAETALAASNYFSSVALGEAATATGELFSTDDGAGVVIFYRRTVGGSVEIGRALTPGLLASATGSSVIGFLQSGTGAVPTTLEAELRDMAVTPQQYLASGESIATDAGPAIRRAYATGKPVRFPNATYIVAPDPASTLGGGLFEWSISIPSNSTSIFDNGAVIKQADNAPGWCRTVLFDGATGFRVFGELKVDANVANINLALDNEHMHGVMMFDCSNFYIEAIDSQNARGDNVGIFGTDDTRGTKDGFIGRIVAKTAGRKNLVFQAHDKVHINSAVLDNTTGGATLYGGVADNTDGNCLDVEADSFTGAVENRSRIDYLQTTGAGNDFTGSQIEAIAEKSVMSIGTWNCTIIPRAGTSWFQLLGGTLHIDNWTLRGVTTTCAASAIQYGCRMRVGDADIVGSAPSAVTTLFDATAVLFSGTIRRPSISFDNIKIVVATGRAFRMADGDLTFGRIYAETNQDVVHILGTSAVAGIFGKLTIGHAHFHNCGDQGSVNRIITVSRDGTEQTIAHIGSIFCKDTRGAKTSRIVFAGATASAGISIGPVDSPDGVATFSSVGPDAFYRTGDRQFVAVGTPEAQIAAGIGAIAQRTDGGAGTTLYVKESGAGNTGWVAK
jgi:hypothetical protein